MIEWKKFTSEENELIGKIADRFMKLTATEPDRLDVVMDLCATHQSCPLKLAELLDADDFNFMHDVAGIRSFMDRETGELRNCFLPRFAR